MAQQWRNTVCALLIGALREKQKRKVARFGYSPKEHQWRKGASRSPTTDPPATPIRSANAATSLNAV